MPVLIPSRAVLSALALSMLPAAAQAQLFDSVRFMPQDEPRVGSVGLAVVRSPEYPGADTHKTRVFPQLDVQWRSGWFAGTTHGIGYRVQAGPALVYGVRLTADLGRDESDSPRLRGLGDIEARPELGAFAEYRLNDAFALNSSLRVGAGKNRDGAVLALGVGYATALAPRWRLGAQVGVSVVDDAHNASYFGVDAAQAAASGLPAYSPGGGLRDARASFSVTWLWSRQVAITAGGSYRQLLGDAADSPIVADKNTPSAFVGIGYRF